MSSFFAMMSRMKLIDRWALMRNTRTENICEHSQEVAILAHALCVLGNRRLGKNLNGERAALIGLYHDASEILTGDMPTPVKYQDEAIRTAYKRLEARADQRLLELLPEDLRPEYEPLFEPAPEDEYLWRLVKAADKLSALIKCLEEEKTGNREFVKAREATLAKLEEYGLPEVKLFTDEFLEPYGRTLDEL